MKIVSVINYKGGVGKTTLTANLATSLALQGKNVLLVDVDPQANLTFSFITIDEWKHSYKQDHTIKELFQNFIKRTPAPSVKDFLCTPFPINDYFKTGGELDLICSHLGLVNIDLELAVTLGGANSAQQRQNYLAVYSILKNSLNQLFMESQRVYDIVLIDCPPNFNIVTKNALVASDYYLIPARPDYLSTLGITELITHIEELKNEYNESVEAVQNGYSKITPQLAGIVFNMVDIHNQVPIKAQGFYIENITNENIPVFDTKLRLGNSIYASAPEKRVPVSALKSQYQEELYNFMLEFSQKVGME